MPRNKREFDIVALPFQLLIEDPFVRKVFRRLFPE